jgi:membrane-associated phospholipid phosphatase
MLSIAIPSLVLFLIMYLLTTHSNEESYLSFMKSLFGYSNSYNSFGPEWLIYITWDLGALAGQVVFVLVAGFVLCFLFVLREQKRLFEFLFTIIGAIILLLILKLTFNTHIAGNVFTVLFSDNIGFPSGHAIISLVLYSALAKYSGSKLIYIYARYVIYIFAAILIFLIGIARLFTSHNPTEVIAGWCAGIFWLSIVNYVFRKN